MQDDGSSAEEWRPVVGWEGVYEVSSFGRVRRVRAGMGATPGLVLKPRHWNSGYLHVHLKRRPIRKARSIHSLVIEAFIGPYPAGHVVNHKDGDRNNNRLSNLEYVTQEQNLAHAEAMGLTPPQTERNRPLGSRNHKSKLTEAQVRVIKATPVTYGMYRKLAREYGVTPAAIKFIVQGKNWRHLSP